jgi:hypothetical protein
MFEFGVLVGQIIVQLPTLLVLVAGLVLLATRRGGLRRSAGLAIAGCVLLLVGTVAGATWGVSIPVLVDEGTISVQEIGAISVGVGLLLSLIHAGGLALLIVAVLTGRRVDRVADRIPDPAPQPPAVAPAEPFTH